MDPFEEILCSGWNLEDVEDFEYSPSHSILSDRFKKTLYLAEGRTDGISLPVADAAVEVFHGVTGSPLKKISPRHVANLSKRSRVAPCTLLLAMIYARRLKTTDETYVQNMTSTDLLLVSMMVASKYLYDEGEDEEMFSDEWAKAANVDLNRVYELEREFLSAMDWNLFVRSEEFFHFIRQLETRIALSQGLSRGWFSYSDLEVLMAQPSWQECCRLVFHQTLKVLGVCLAVYTLCATSIIWSSVLLHHPRLMSPSICGCLPMTLDLHPKKSTSMYHNLDSIDTLPHGSEICQCQIEETNVSMDTVEVRLVDGSDCSNGPQEYPSVTDMTVTLKEKYYAAKHALLVFYRALLTAVSDVSFANSMQAECNVVSSPKEVDCLCVCRCNLDMPVKKEDSSYEKHERSPSVKETSEETGSCNCPCRHQNKMGRWWKQSNETNETGGELGYTTSSFWLELSKRWYYMWSGGVNSSTGGDQFLWSMPSLKHKYIDLEMRFATISY